MLVPDREYVNWFVAVRPPMNAWAVKHIRHRRLHGDHRLVDDLNRRQAARGRIIKTLATRRD